MLAAGASGVGLSGEVNGDGEISGVTAWVGSEVAVAALQEKTRQAVARRILLIRCVRLMPGIIIDRNGLADMRFSFAKSWAGSAAPVAAGFQGG